MAEKICICHNYDYGIRNRVIVSVPSYCPYNLANTPYQLTCRHRDQIAISARFFGFADQVQSVQAQADKND